MQDKTETTFESYCQDCGCKTQHGNWFCDVCWDKKLEKAKTFTSKGANLIAQYWTCEATMRGMIARIIKEEEAKGNKVTVTGDEIFVEKS